MSAKLDQAEIVRQISKVVGGKPFDFWLVNAHNNLDRLVHFLLTVDVPKGAEVFTSEGIYPGSRMEALLREECHNGETQQEIDEAERAFLIEFAKELQGLGKFNGIGLQVLRIAKQKGIKLWLGAPYLEISPGSPDKLYNAFLLIEDGRIRYVHRKKFLWNGGRHGIESETGVFELVGNNRRSPISVAEYDGIFQNRAHLICQEADAFFCPKWRHKPTHIPEVREAKPDFVVIPARWLNKVGDEETFLRKIALAIARRIKEPVDRLSAVRKEGSLVLVINAFDAYVCGPVDEKKIKARVYAQQSNPGWIRINNHGITQGEM